MNSVHTRGFVALMSVLLVSAILLTIVFTLNLSSFFARYDALGAENKRISLGLAEACVEAAKLRLALDASYSPPAGGESVSVNGTNTCKICSVAASGSNTYTIVTRAVRHFSFSTITVTGVFSSSTFALTNYSENASYLGPSCTLP